MSREKRRRKRRRSETTYAGRFRRDTLEQPHITRRSLYKPLQQNYKKDRYIPADRRSYAYKKNFTRTDGRVAETTLSRPYSKPGLIRVYEDGTLSDLRFKQPKDVFVCIRRKKRREVLFATRKSGFGRKVSRPRYTEQSEISCKRR